MFCRSFLASLVTAAFLLNVQSAHSQDDEFIDKIAALELEELLRLDVTSVLRKPQKLSSAPSAIYVITAEDIRRAGVTNLAEALRLAPGVNVARAHSSSWIVSARGFDTLGATKMLVLIDGRTVYSPFFSGVFWDIQDVVLEDIERIEVIRGPGAVTWGENAVNGVVNVITKKASETQGFLISGGGGKEENAFGAVRFGGSLGEETAYRLYAKGFERDEFRLQNGEEADDNWNQLRAGFRFDSQLDESSQLTVRGDIYDGESNEPRSLFTSFSPPFVELVRNPITVEGRNLLVRYTKELRENSTFTAQAFYDYAGRSDIVSHEYRDLFELDLQHHYTLSERHDFVYGLTYRLSADDMGESLGVEWHPPERTDQLITVFFQDEISLVPDEVSLIPGIKLGYNDYSGFEYQPALKGSWAFDQDSAVWASVSRAVRIPSRFNEDVEFISTAAEGPGGVPVLSTILGNRDFDSEELIAYELGYRTNILTELSLDVTTYYHNYSNLQSLEAGTPFAETIEGRPFIYFPITFDNQMNDDTYGVELAATWRATDYFTLAASYTYTEVQLDLEPGSADIGSLMVERRTPHNLASVRAHLNLPWDLEFDTMLYYVDSMPSFDVSSSIRTDLRLGYRIREGLVVDLIAQNIFDDRHREYGGSPAVEVERAVFGRVTWKFP